MYRETYLQIPGPTNIPKPILDALSSKAINHRGEEYASLMDFNIRSLKRVFKTENDILIFPSSGSGGLEASIVNTLSPGDKVVAINMGVFSQRYGLIAQAYDAEVIWIDVKWGEAVKPTQLAGVLESDINHEIKAVLLTHNETATAVKIDMQSLIEAINKVNHPALVFVDAVSSIAISDLPTDKLGIDIVVTGSQKGLMLPGGLAILSVSKRAWEAQRSSEMPKWYWDFKPLQERMRVGQMPYTPVISHFFALKVALELIEEETLEVVFERHKKNASALRSAIKAMGLQLLVKKESERSDAVTAIHLPDNIQYQSLASLLADEFNLIIGGGLQELKGKIFRVGHLGCLHKPEIIAIVSAIEMGLYKLGYDAVIGEAAKAAAHEFLA